MKKPNPSGRSILLLAGGAPATEEPARAAAAAAGTPTPRLKAKPHSAGIPLSHGKHSQAQVEAWDAEGLRRREGNAPRPAWQYSLRAGCCRCMAPAGFLPLSPEEARGVLEGRGWRWWSGRWICSACAGEQKR